MRRWIFIAAALALVLAAAAFFWHKAATERRVTDTMAVARELLDKGRASEAKVLLQATKPPSKNSPSRAAWFDIEVRSAMENRQFELLRRLSERDPEGFSRNNEAASWLQRLTMAQDGALPENAGPILSADKAMLAGDPDAARRTLESAKLEGKDDATRLTRLALLNADNPGKAWELLNQAYAVNPKSADVRTFSANLLEQEGDTDLARRDYIAAVLAEPANPRARDNLAEFYIRQGMLPQAVQTWLDAPPADASWIFYLKAWFWNRVGLGSLPPKDPAALGKLVSALAALPAGDFWSNSLDDAVAKSPLLADRGETLWLRILQQLKDGQDSNALRILAQSAPEQTAHHAYLRTALQFLLEVRMGVGSNSHLEIPGAKTAGHPFWKWLEDNKSDPAALRQPWVLPTLFCVSGWFRAGVDTCKPESLAEAPEWAAYALARSAQILGDNKRLAEFLAATPLNSPAMQILRAESAWMDNKRDAGRTILVGLLGQPDAGYRAAFLLAMDALTRNDAAEASRVIALQPDFAASVTGRELLARAALAEGKENEAIAIYEALGDSSDDARIYLARAAYNAKQWGRAEALVLSLIADHPNEPAFAANLEQIREEKPGR